MSRKGNDIDYWDDNYIGWADQKNKTEKGANQQK